MKYAIIQDGYCIWGEGDSVDECVKDANTILDEPVEYEAHESRHTKLIDRTNGRHHQVNSGDMYITDNQTYIGEYP